MTCSSSFFTEKKDKVLFMTTKHGGHLGYFEGGYIIPHHITWLDRVLVQYADAVVDIHLHGNLVGQGVKVTDSGVQQTNGKLVEDIHMVENSNSNSQNKMKAVTDETKLIDLHASHSSVKAIENLIHDFTETSPIT